MRRGFERLLMFVRTWSSQLLNTTYTLLCDVVAKFTILSFILENQR